MGAVRSGGNVAGRVLGPLAVLLAAPGPIAGRRLCRVDKVPSNNFLYGLYGMFAHDLVCLASART